MQSVVRVLLLAFVFATASATAATSSPAVVPEPVFAPADNDLAAIRQTLDLPRATWYNDRDGDKVFDTLEERFLTDPLSIERVVVLFRSGTDADAGLADAKRVAGPFEAAYVYRILGGFAAPLSFDQVTAIASLESVRQVEWSQPGAPELDTATESMGVRAVQQALNRTGDLDGSPGVASPRDVTIGVLDTGFDGEHVDLEGRFLAFLDMEDKELKEPYDSGSHGTHVGSIAAGQGVGDADYRGVAPGAALVGIKISGTDDTKAAAIAGMEWLIEHKDEYNIRISTISFGFGQTVDGTDALELAMDKAFEAGILPFKSNGNGGPEQSTTTIPGGARGIVSTGSMLDPMGSEGAAAGLPGGLGGATTDYGFHISSYSSRGPTADGRVKPDVAAPGQSVMAASAGSGDGYVASSGTSMASPFAAGVAALVLSADPSLGPEQVRQVLFTTAEDWGPEGPDNDYGHGRINALLAVQTALVERLVRDNESLDEVERIAGVTGPAVPWHTAGSLSGAVTADSFTVEDPDQPLALTGLYTGTEVPVAGRDARVLVLQLRGPDDLVVGDLALGPTLRQQTITFLPSQAGEYEIEVVNPTVGGGTVTYDVSAGLPPPELLPQVALPNATEYAERLAAADTGGDAPSVPGMSAFGLLLAAGVTIVLLARRSRPGL